MLLVTWTTQQIKFSQQHTCASHNLPATALWVTCTYDHTHITPSGQQGNVTITLQPQQTKEEHLANLHPDKRWASLYLDLLDNGTPLGEAIRTGQVHAVNNRSFKEKFGTAVWVFYHRETNATLGSE